MQNAEESGGATAWYRRELHGFWRVLGIALTVLVVSLIALGIYRIPAVKQQQKSEETVALIQAQNLTMNDVDGKHLPPPPDPKQVDATVAGIDANQNGIRDDVELAIFAKYPNDIRVRAAELQYAMAEQMYLTSVFSTDTWKAAAIQLDRGYQCIGETFPRTNLAEFIRVTNQRTEDVENLIFNTKEREVASQAADKFTTSFGSDDQSYCDLNSIR